jgi:hypothetical protein
MQISDTQKEYTFHARSRDNDIPFCPQVPASSFVIYQKVSLCVYQGICRHYNWIKKNRVVRYSVMMVHGEDEGITNGLFVRGVVTWRLCIKAVATKNCLAS